MKNQNHNLRDLNNPPPGRNGQGVAMDDEDTEHPIDYIELFEEICGVTATSKESQNYSMCKLFPFSLEDKASRWLKSLPPALIATWEECKAAFLNHFYTRSRSNLLRSKIQGFRQGKTESFSEGWERFRAYERDCPQHGFTDGGLMNKFYEGIDPKNQLSLDVASNNNFATKTIEDARILIYNLSESDNNYRSTPLDEEEDSDQASDIKQLKETMSLIVKHIQKGDDTFEDEEKFCDKEEELNYIGARSNYQGRFHNRNVKDQGHQLNRGNFRQRATFTDFQGFQRGFPNPTMRDQGPDLRDWMLGIETSVQAFIEDTNLKMSDMYKDLNDKMTSLTIKINEQVLDLANLKAILLRSGTAYKEPEYPEKDRTPEVIPVEEEEGTIGEKEIEELIHDEITKDTLPQVPPSTRIYKPKVPYPTKVSKKEKERGKLKELVGQLSVRLPFVEACAMIPPLRKYMKSIFTNNVSLEDGVMVITQECSAILQNDIPQKRGDPGSFVLSCRIKDEVFKRSLCNLGSSINMIPRSVAKRLGYHFFKPTKISLVLADRSIRRPVRIVVDVPIVIGACQIPTYFVILELEKEPKDPLILGRPFLSTTGVIIDVPNEKIDLNLGGYVMKFYMNESLKLSISENLYNPIFTIKDLEEDTSGVCEDIFFYDPLEIALTRAQKEYNFQKEEVENCANILDSAETCENIVAYLDLDEENDAPTSPKNTPAAVADPWSELRAPKPNSSSFPLDSSMAPNMKIYQKKGSRLTSAAARTGGDTAEARDSQGRGDVPHSQGRGDVSHPPPEKVLEQLIVQRPMFFLPTQ
ncbi:PREDICTED: uncharacterized protein LOC104779119 [Camelina sativa]|uniref:Uncharacterized protein LOC104779119 n=1 Tax=Camelina sativa TaxID=90675 RepID=A0ABM0YJ94_CAMSA|nr:PREDICTED: uncharacterized protein LOC104779119 [Camelina sativa]